MFRRRNGKMAIGYEIGGDISGMDRDTLARRMSLVSLCAADMVKAKWDGRLLNATELLEALASANGETLNLMLDDAWSERDGAPLFAALRDAGFSVRMKVIDHDGIMVSTSVSVVHQCRRLDWSWREENTPALTFADIRDRTNDGTADPREIGIDIVAWYEQAKAVTGKLPPLATGDLDVLEPATPAQPMA
jgi:hypothetical protein